MQQKRVPFKYEYPFSSIVILVLLLLSAAGVFLAVLYHNVPAFNLLLKHHCDMNIKDKYGITALGWAIKENHTGFAAALRKAGANE